MSRNAGYDAKNRWPIIATPIAQSRRPGPVPPRVTIRAPKAPSAQPPQRS
jgi:hypothetical protein